MSEKTLLILDKNYLQGAGAPEVQQLCTARAAVMPDVLFYEMISCDEPRRSDCFRKLPGVDNPIMVVPNTGALLRFELENREACGKPSEHALDVHYRFNPKLSQAGYVLPAEAQAVLDQAKVNEENELRDFVQLLETAPMIFPDVFEKGISDAVRDERQRQTLAELGDDVSIVRDALNQLSGPLTRRLRSCELGPDWIHYRWLQVKLASVLDLARRFSQMKPPFTPKQTHTLANFVYDMQYAMLALLEGGLASRDEWLRNLVMGLRKDVLLLPPSAEAALHP
jgi:hypothetical protein